MIIDKLIPFRPHAQVGGLIGSYNDREALIVRMAEFALNGATRTAKDLLLYEALVNTGARKSERKIEDNEITAGKSYLGDLGTYLQHWRALQNIRICAPRLITNIADGVGKNIWSIDEIETEIQNVMAEPLISFPGMENFITELNPIWTLEYEYELLDLPPSKFLAWAPNLTITEADTLRKSMTDKVDLFQNLCNKVQLKTNHLDIGKFMSTRTPTINTLDFKDYRWRFWAYSALWFQVNDSVPATHMHHPSLPGGATEDIDAEGDETWLTDGNLGYIPEEAHAYNAVIKMLYRYYATDNPLGAVYEPDAASLNCAGPADDESYFANIAINDVSGADKHKAFVAMTNEESVKTLGAVFGAHMYTATYPGVKYIDSDPVLNKLYLFYLAGGYRYLPYVASIWNTNYNKERAFWGHIIRSGESTTKGQERRKSSKHSRGFKASKKGNAGKASYASGDEGVEDDTDE